MSDVTIKSMIYYDTEDERDNYRYKDVSATKPLDVKYEDGMYTFNFIRYYNVIINGKEYYIVVNRDNKNYSFGMSETLRNIVDRVNHGENFNGYEKETIEHYIERNGENYTFWVTGRNTLTLDYNKDKVPADIVSDKTPDLDIGEEQIIDAKIEWYIEYKNYSEDNWHVEPTFCSDKKFRGNPNIEKYRFVNAAVYEIDGTTYYDVIKREETVHENKHEINNSDEVTEAIDAAKTLIYGKDENSEMFAGYTRIYPFNTEDSSSIFKLQEDKIRNQDVLTVTGSGDALLDLFMQGANTVTCFDINGMAKFYAMLKFSFVKAGMPYQEFKEFFLGKGKNILDKTIYDKYSQFLDEDLKRFWDGVYEYLNTNNRKLLNSEHNLFYKIYDFFGNANQSYRNNCSYFGNEDNYATLQETLKDKNLSDVNFVDCSLFDLPKRLEGKKYEYAYLSNILDFTELYFEMDDELARKKAFKEFVRNELTEIIEENGTIDVGFISKEWQIGEPYINTTQAFDEKEGFIIRDLYPYNSEDKVIVFKNRDLSLEEETVLK